YTRPADYRGMKVPDVLLSGYHGEIEKWREAQALKRTQGRRKDLLHGK
ncbi:MAG: tRNA (guanosine(37)-N1)-methyltransferase TrmD, partial [Bacteroidota bacterium]